MRWLTVVGLGLFLALTQGLELAHIFSTDHHWSPGLGVVHGHHHCQLDQAHSHNSKENERCTGFLADLRTEFEPCAVCSLYHQPIFPSLEPDSSEFGKMHESTPVTYFGNTELASTKRYELAPKNSPPA